ncbi:hypothetical protein NVP1060A_56 [Vibrio phage 1.060.A._10N.261.48.B5]|nr:hypothetical protein NVP1060A_56 [Vibrio phage 1.060.A._10N.261.48.B5]
MKHKHHDKIVAKASNTGLVQFIKMNGEWEDAGLSDKFISFSEEYDYFLCLPQHKEACLHWLGGGEAQGEDPNRPNYFDDYANFVDRKNWSCSSWYMRKDINVRINTKKEKRWIIINTKYEEVDERLFEDEPDMLDRHPDSKAIQIEVEV